MTTHDTVHDRTKALGPGEGERVEFAVVIYRTPAELYRLWTDLERLSRVFEHVESITLQPGGRSHWVVKGPLGTRYEWNAEIVNQLENEHIGWQSLPGGDVAAAGAVHFHPVGDGATELVVTLRYDPPGGALGSMIASILGADPARQIADDLHRLKAEVESDRVAAKDCVRIASEDSFPASDPPAWTTRGPGARDPES